jgi:hypothetical protein
MNIPSQPPGAIRLNSGLAAHLEKQPGIVVQEGLDHRLDTTLQPIKIPSTYLFHGWLYMISS